jgi:tRNA(Phe) wybutosine-synthesizing methylase Tyw3
MHTRIVRGHFLFLLPFVQRINFAAHSVTLNACSARIMYAGIGHKTATSNKMLAINGVTMAKNRKKSYVIH